MRTFTRRKVLRNTLLAVVALLAAAVAPRTHARAYDSSSLTFTRDVMLPGVLLPPGTYLFEVANPGSSSTVVRVASKAGQVQYMGFTMLVTRPHRLGQTGTVTLGEAPAGTPSPILAWFPGASSSGYQFLYR